MELVLSMLREMAEYHTLRERMRTLSGVLSVTGCVEAQKAQLIYGLAYDAPSVVVITENDLTAKTFSENLRFYEPDTQLYPAKDLLFYQADVASNLLDQQRMAVFRSLFEKKHTVTVLPAPALMDRVTTPDEMDRQILFLESGEEFDFEELKKSLVLLGYERCAEVTLPGQFAFRGDIMDLWALTEERPVRVEFFGDEIDSMRTFDPESQRSVEEISQLAVYPARDNLGQTGGLLEWFSGEKCVFFLDLPGRIREAMNAVEEEFRESVKNRIAQGTYNKEEMPEIASASSVLAQLNRRRCVALSMLEMKPEGFAVADTCSLQVQAVNAYNSSFEMLLSDLKKYRERNYRVVLLSGSHTRAKRLARDLTDNGVSAFYTENTDLVLEGGQAAVLYGHVSRGFEYPLIRCAFISDTDIFGEKKRTVRRKKNYSGQKIASFSELHVGDYVVHENHGLGIYRGIEKVEVDHVLKDYIKLEYKGSNLYILATQLDRLQKYASQDADGTPPKLNRLGGEAWQKTRARVKKSVRSIAKDLVKLYASRQQKDGYVCGPDTEWQKEFEELFPYEETEDQLLAIEDTKRDMESRKIMDRLICGDVGYGKTEIALRAAFKAVQEDRQVVYLVPTTILAQQHFNTFAQRMKDFPVRVDLLCRFRTPAQQEKTIRDLKSGAVDIVIGTHRLLSKDVSFKNLGLLIIDEEQRFGVTAKEKIKELRRNVDVLTLTATPIPRTLHMSLIGIRDMSILEEPPQDRVPIQTYVMEFNPELVREAVCRELARGGQVYYVYNRVRDIADMASRLQNMVPEARIAYAHGQMKEAELEQIMVSFINGEIDVLVTTTIIETGLDIANVNTMIIHDADKMGLSQLYQLRGRVGRSNRTAYAFLMYRKDKLLPEVAEKRLSAIREFTELGSGFKIAMRDLEIRGAGNLLGPEQHGHMDAVGYDLYCKLLTEAVQEVKGEAPEEDFETVVDLSMDAFIPDRYVPNEFQKLDFYKRIAGISSDEDYEEISNELMDRFGVLPQPVQNLLLIADLKAYAHRASITEIKELRSEVKLTVRKDPSFDTARIPDVLAKHLGDFTIHPFENETFFRYHGDREPEKMIPALKSFAMELAGA